MSHAKNSPSGSHGWMNCPGQLNAIDTLEPGEQDSGNDYADEGTAAHKLGDACLKDGTNAADRIGEKIRVGEKDWEVTTDMAWAVQIYLDEIRRQWAEAGPDAMRYMEHRVNLEWLRPDLFGTVDSGVVKPFHWLDVTDYKHGAGVRVDVEWNSQLMIYALGMLHDIGGPDDVDEVRVRVVQPRHPHPEGPVRMWPISAHLLWEWGRDTLGPGIDLTKAVDAPLVAGDWCHKSFCSVFKAGRCPAADQRVLEVAQQDFSDAPFEVPLADENDPVEIARHLGLVPFVEEWAKETKKIGLRRLMRGLTVPGKKLVYSNPNRKWESEERTEKALSRRKGILKKDTHETKLRSPAQMEKIKGLGKEFTAEHAFKPQGTLVMADESDKRLAIAAPAVTDFLPATTDEN